MVGPDGVKDRRRAEMESRGDEPVPKRYKHTKHVEVARDEAGKPIMPLSVSERLTVLSLVRGLQSFVRCKCQLSGFRLENVGPETQALLLFSPDQGTVVHDRLGFHTERHIFPVGFTSRRTHYSMKEAGKKTQYTSTILDTGDGVPLFRVTPEDLPEECKESFSASGAWVAVCTVLNHLKGVAREKVGM